MAPSVTGQGELSSVWQSIRVELLVSRDKVSCLRWVGAYSHLCGDTGSISVAIAFVITSTSGSWTVWLYRLRLCQLFRTMLSCSPLCNSPPTSPWTGFTFISPLIADCQPSGTSSFPREEGKTLVLRMEEFSPKLVKSGRWLKPWCRLVSCSHRP